MLDKTSGVGFRQRLSDPQALLFFIEHPVSREAPIEDRFGKAKADELVKSLKMPFSVILAKAGIKHLQTVTNSLDSGACPGHYLSGVRRSDDFL